MMKDLRYKNIPLAFASFTILYLTLVTRSVRRVADLITRSRIIRNVLLLVLSIVLNYKT